jgi:hypothetical protein
MSSTTTAWRQQYMEIYGANFTTCGATQNCGNTVAIYGFNSVTGTTQYNYFTGNTGNYGAITYEGTTQINMLLPAYISGVAYVSVYNGTKWSAQPGPSFTIY